MIFLLYLIVNSIETDERVCSTVFSNHMYVFVNGSLTKEFVMERGLHKGDLISPFLFVIVAEALVGLVRKATKNGDFSTFRVREACTVDILQFAEDTLLIGKGGWQHVWSLKSILRGFELIAGLGVNFLKSKLIGININTHFLSAAANFLCCSFEEK